MSQYKVPQDVEADDKLLGPFTFRQLIYLFITAGLCIGAYFLARIFIVLVLIPVPLILLFGALALPLKKDQPMETYLAALVSYYLKPHNRYWVPGQSESTIQIIAPKTAEESRVRNISGDEASHRLSFLANIVDSEGNSIRDTSTIRSELIEEANSTTDIFDSYSTPSLDRIISNQSTAHRTEVVNQMKAAIKEHESLSNEARNGQLPKISRLDGSVATVKPVAPTPQPSKQPKSPTPPPKPEIVALANDSELSVETIAKQAQRINGSRIDETNETFISLH